MEPFSAAFLRAHSMPPPVEAASSARAPATDGATTPPPMAPSPLPSRRTKALGAPAATTPHADGRAASVDARRNRSNAPSSYAEAAMPAAPLTALHARTHSSPAPGKYAGGGDSGNGTPTAAAAVVAAVAASVPASSRPSGSGGLQIVGYEESGEEVATTTPEFPQRPGRQLCDFYVKTGNCKFGADCVNDHPLEYAVRCRML
eukprot:23571-Chlamydomonas_euryale.AAC.1